ncbi:hypothetical protein Plec18170_009187 [Paecilomyces lecythidis]
MDDDIDIMADLGDFFGMAEEAEGVEQEQQQPPPPPPPPPLVNPFGPLKMTKAQKKRKRADDHDEAIRKQARAEYAAELASKGVVIPPEEDTRKVQLESKPELTAAQKLRKEELLAALETCKDSRKQKKVDLRTLKTKLGMVEFSIEALIAQERQLEMAIEDTKDAIRGEDDAYDRIVDELKKLS